MKSLTLIWGEWPGRQNRTFKNRILNGTVTDKSIYFSHSPPPQKKKKNRMITILDLFQNHSLDPKSCSSQKKSGGAKRRACVEFAEFAEIPELRDFHGIRVEVEFLFGSFV